MWQVNIMIATIGGYSIYLPVKRRYYLFLSASSLLLKLKFYLRNKKQKIVVDIGKKVTNHRTALKTKFNFYQA